MQAPFSKFSTLWTELPSFRASLLWNTIDDELKLSPSLEKFKRKYVAGMTLAVHVLFAINLVLFTFN